MSLPEHSDPEAHTPPAQPGGALRNRFDRMEWAGAFGDLGTLIPFLVVYISVLGMNATGVLFAFGGVMVVVGLVYRTPFPVQPMKAIGAVVAAQAVQTAVVTPGAVAAAALVTGLLWLVIGFGTLFLALPQLPLTLGNAVIAITGENNRLFPQAPVTERKVVLSTGLMNLFSAGVGGVPMCRGAGGMAGHMAFGARTGGAVVILGGVLLVLALFFSSSVLVLFKLFPTSILGVILFLTGAQLAVGASPLGEQRSDRLVVLATAATCMWNVAIGMAVGLVLHHLARRSLLKL